LLFGASTKEAEASFAQALEVARTQEARSFEPRAATSLADLWRRQGNLIGAVFGYKNNHVCGILRL
jgi:hypothetical protein